MKHILYKVMGVVSLIGALIGIFMACTGRGSNAKLDITVKETKYNIVVGETIKLGVFPEKIDYDVTADMPSYVDIVGLSVTAKRTGKVSVTISASGVTRAVELNIYDRIVAKDAQINSDRYYMSIASAIESTSSGESIFIKSGRYDESVNVDKDISLKGEDDVIVSSMTIDENLRVSIDNLSFYSREYPKENTASIYAQSGVILSVTNSSFFVDKKQDIDSDRIGGSAIYVRPNSKVIQLVDNTFDCYYTAVNIESTDAYILVNTNRFSKVNTAIIIDVRDLSSSMPFNKNATGEISDNTYYDTVQDIDFRYAGDSYDGRLKIEKHDKL